MQAGEASLIIIFVIFKKLPHEQKISLLKANHICLNFLTGGHHGKNCKSVHRCRRCQGLNHTLLHVDNESTASSSSNPVTSNSAVKLDSSGLLMRCRVLFTSRIGSAVEAHCLLDNASSASFISRAHRTSLVSPKFISVCVCVRYRRHI